MENAIDYSMRHINRAIPIEIRNVAFNTNALNGIGLRRPISLNEQVKLAVIHEQLIPDLTSLDGMECTIPLGGLPCRILPDLRVLIEIPTVLTGGRSIISCQRVNYYYDQGFGRAAGGYSNSSVGMINLIANDILDSSTRIPCTSTSVCEVLPGNVIIADVLGVVPLWMSVTVTLENDSDLSFIRPTAYRRLGEVAVALAKYITYNRIDIAMDEGRIEMASELGRFADRVRNWSDMDRTYNDLLVKFRRTMIHEDPERMNKFTNYLVGSL